MSRTAKPSEQRHIEGRASDDPARAWQPPTQEEIRRRAYELYLEREHEWGGALDDWLEAEAELLFERRRKDP